MGSFTALGIHTLFPPWIALYLAHTKVLKKKKNVAFNFKLENEGPKKEGPEIIILSGFLVSHMEKLKLREGK